MKSKNHTKNNSTKASRPARGAWVEMLKAWNIGEQRVGSRPARGAWVEINAKHTENSKGEVAPRKGRVG